MLERYLRIVTRGDEARASHHRAATVHDGSGLCGAFLERMDVAA